jgi:hypothetical protein
LLADIRNLFGRYIVTIEQLIGNESIVFKALRFGVYIRYELSLSNCLRHNGIRSNTRENFNFIARCEPSETEKPNEPEKPSDDAEALTADHH